MTPRQRRRLQRKLEDQMRLERNGAPIPREVAAGMTKPAVLHPLFQVHVEVKDRMGRKRIIPVGPRVAKAYAESFLFAINTQIALGKEKLWTNPHLICMSTNLVEA